MSNSGPPFTSSEFVGANSEFIPDVNGDHTNATKPETVPDRLVPNSLTNQSTFTTRPKNYNFDNSHLLPLTYQTDYCPYFPVINNTPSIDPITPQTQYQHDNVDGIHDIPYWNGMIYHDNSRPPLQKHTHQHQNSNTSTLSSGSYGSSLSIKLRKSSSSSAANLFKEGINYYKPVKPMIATTYWDDQKTICYQVESHGIFVSRRDDNNYVNGTKLLNVAGMSRGKRDGILKSERVKTVVRIGAMNLKGVWLPFERASEIARNEGIDELLYPLFLKDLKGFFAKEGSLLKMDGSVTKKLTNESYSNLGKEYAFEY